MRSGWLFGLLVGLLLGLSALAFGPTSASAASFDCSKARTPFAKTICSNTALSQADEVLAKTFATTLSRLSADAKPEVSQAQDAWVKFANIACTKTARLATKPYDADGIACLQSLFDARTKQLQNVKSLHGLTFYYVDRYAALPDPDPANDNADVAPKLVSAPRIDADTAEAVAFNHYIETGTQSLIDPAIAEHPKPEDGAADDANDLIATYVDDDRITMILTTYEFGHGAAHGNYAISYLHYLRKEQRPLAAGDVFAGEAWQEKVQALALAAVKQAEGDELQLDDPKSLNDIVIDPTRWDFSKQGLVLQFEPYEIAAYAVGAPTVTIPWSQLDGILAPSIDELRP